MQGAWQKLGEEQVEGSYEFGSGHIGDTTPDAGAPAEIVNVVRYYELDSGIRLLAAGPCGAEVEFETTPGNFEERRYFNLVGTTHARLVLPDEKSPGESGTDANVSLQPSVGIVSKTPPPPAGGSETLSFSQTGPQFAFAASGGSGSGRVSSGTLSIAVPLHDYVAPTTLDRGAIRFFTGETTANTAEFNIVENGNGEIDWVTVNNQNRIKITTHNNGYKIEFLDSQRVLTFDRITTTIDTVGGPAVVPALEYHDSWTGETTTYATTSVGTANAGEYRWEITGSDRWEKGYTLLSPGTQNYSALREVYVTRKDDLDTPARATLETREIYHWGEEIISTITDPSGINPETGFSDTYVGLNLETQYSYYGGDIEDRMIWIGRLESVLNHDGSWRYYEYAIVGDHLTTYVVEPWVDEPVWDNNAPDWDNVPGTNLGSFDKGNYQGKLTTVKERSFGPGHHSLAPASSTVTIDQEVVEYTETQSGTAGGFDFEKTIRHTGRDNTKLISKTLFYSGSDHRRGKVHSEFQTIENTDATTDPTVVLASYDYRRGEITGVPEDAVFAADPTKFAEETTRTELPEIVDETTKTVTFTDPAGNTAFSETWIFTAGGYQLAERTAYSYDDRGRRLKEWRGAGPGVMLVVGETIYDSETETTSIDASGTVTKIFTEADGSVYETVKGTADPTNFEAAVTTEYESSTEIIGGKKHDRQVTTTTGGAQSATSVSISDLAGRTVSSAGSAGLETTYAYDPIGGTTTTTNPSGATTIVTSHLDGQQESVTGTAGVANYTSYEILPSGFIKTTNYVGSATSPRYSSTTTDKAGRVFETRRPRYPGGEVIVTHYYNGKGQLKLITTRTEADAVVTADQRWTHRARGEVEFSGYDLDGTEGFQLSGAGPATDQFSQQISGYLKIGTAWWRYSQTNVAHTPDPAMPQNGASQLVSQQRSRIAPYGGQTSLVLSETFTHNPENPVASDPPGSETHGVTTKTVANRGTKTVTQTTELHDVSDIIGTSITVNGLLQKSRGTTHAGFTEYYYDGLERNTGYRDPRTGRRNVVHYHDTTGQQDYAIDFEGNTTNTSYRPAGSPGAGQLDTITHPDDTTTIHTYTLRGEVATIRGTAGYPLDYEYYSAYGGLWKMHTYRDLALPASKSTTIWVNDPGTGTLKEKIEAGDSTLYVYDANPLGPHKVLRNSLGKEIITMRDTLGRPASREMTGFYSGKLVYAYDRRGQMISVDGDAGYGDNDWSFAYSASGRMTDEEVSGTGNLDGLEIKHLVDNAGRPDKLTAGFGTAPEQVNVKYTYDPSSRLDLVQDLAESHTAKYSYHPSSDLIHTLTTTDTVPSSTRQVVTSRAYSPSNQLQRVSTRDVATGAVLSAHGYHYDSMNRRTRADRHDGTYWEYGYNDRGEVTDSAKYLSGSPAAPEALDGYTTGYSYDDIGNRRKVDTWLDATNKSTTQYGGTSKANSANERNQYTSIDNPDTILVSGSASGPVTVSTPGATVHAPISLQPSGSPRYFSTWVTTPYNGGGSVFQRSSVSSGGATETRDTYIPWATEAVSHNADGTLRRDGRWHYEFDAENRLRALYTSSPFENPTGPNGDSVTVPKQRLEFDYDFRGRRISKRVYTWTGGAYTSGGAQVPSHMNSSWTETSSQKFIYDGWNVIARYATNDNSAPQQTYLWGTDLSGSMQGAGGVGGLLAVSAAGGDKWFPTYDGNGNVTAMIAANAGGTSSTRDYDAFGKTVAAGGSTDVPFGFSTKYQDAETGMLYYGFRYYQPSTGRWLSRDPIEEDGGVNLYGFVGNDGVNGIDRLGLIQWKPAVQLGFRELGDTTGTHQGIGFMVKTDKGRDLQAFLTPTGQFFCHGYTFDGLSAGPGSKPLSILGGDVPKLLEDEWEWVPCANAPKKSIVIFYNNNEAPVHHSAKIAKLTTKFNKKSGKIEVNMGRTQLTGKHGVGGRLKPTPFAIDVIQYAQFRNYRCYAKKSSIWERWLTRSTTRCYQQGKKEEWKEDWQEQ